MLDPSPYGVVAHLASLSIENLAGVVVRVELADGELRELAPRHYLARKSDGQQT